MLSWKVPSVWVWNGIWNLACLTSSLVILMLQVWNLNLENRYPEPISPCFHTINLYPFLSQKGQLILSTMAWKEGRAEHFPVCMVTESSPSRTCFNDGEELQFTMRTSSLQQHSPRQESWPFCSPSCQMGTWINLSFYAPWLLWEFRDKIRKHIVASKDTMYIIM